MTTAKPKHMAGQTDSADDLIAELARLMAEDAQSDKPKSEPAMTVRIPGGNVPAAMAPAEETEAPNRPVRIPGGDSPPQPEPFVFDFDRKSRPQAAEPKLETPQRVEPAAFSAKPAMSETSAAAEPRAAAQPAPAPAAPVEPIAIAPQDIAPPAPEFSRPEPVLPTSEVMPALDQDSLADLIAAELAVSDISEPEAREPAMPVEELDVTNEVYGRNFPREVDSFGVPPVFGLGSGSPGKPEVHPGPVEVVAPEIALAETTRTHEPEQPRPRVQPDPLDEIERLIGPAAHVQPMPAAPSPALRSLATPTLPSREPEPARVAPQVQNRVQVTSVEEAILAAAETSGARVEWVEPAIEAPLPLDEPEKAPKAPRGRFLGMTRSLAGPLVATLLLAVAAVGLYTVLGFGTGTPDGPAPLVVADATPTKEVPEPSPSAGAAGQSVVFNEIAGVNTGAEEQIVSRDQADVETVATAAPPTSISEEGLVNRKVRTVTVRPDGTIVSGGDSLAGSSMLPVDRPTVPEVPGADFSTPDLIANAATATQTPAPVATAPAVVPVQPGSTVPVVDLAGNPVNGKTAPVPLVRPTSFRPQAAVTTPAAGTTLTPAVTASTPAPAPTLPAPVAQQTATPSSGGSAPAYVQLSSQRTEETARQTAQSIASRFGSLFGGASLEVQRVDLGERGIFYRVRVPASSLQEANAICSRVKANGGDCFTL